MSVIFKWLGDGPVKQVQPTEWHPQSNCPPGYVAVSDASGKSLCVPDLAAAEKAKTDFIKNVVKLTQEPPPPAPSSTTVPAEVNFVQPPSGGGAPATAEPPKGDVIMTCPPGQVLLNGKCVPIPQQLPPEKPAAPTPAEEKKTPWGLIVLGVAGAAGLVWSLTRGAREVGGALRANPRAKTFGWYVIVNSERRVLAVYGNQLHDEAAGKLREVQRIGWAELIPVKSSLADKPRVGSILPARYGSGLRANSAYASRKHLRAMTKVEAKRMFEQYVLPHVVERYGPGDRVAIRTAWNDWTDQLHKDGRITRKQVDTWTSPYS